jgi:hypothetical protein
MVGTWLELGSGKLLQPGWLLVAALLVAPFGFVFGLSSLRLRRPSRILLWGLLLNLAVLLTFGRLLFP